MIDLLDSDVLIALCVFEHPHHQAALDWVDASLTFAVCPITEGALVRYIYRVAHRGQGLSATQEAFRFLREHPRRVFWPATIPFQNAPLRRIQGYKQVTDAYLVALASAHGGRLATFDRALVAVHSEAVLVPT